MRHLWMLLLLLAAPAWADPIQPSGSSPYADRTACKVGDTVLILIKDVTSVIQRVDAQSRRESHANAFGLGQMLGLFFQPVLDNSLRSGSRANDDHTEKFESALSAAVVSVAPSGALQIQGRRVITLNGQRQELAIGGEVRPQDLSAENSIPSNRITNLTVDYKGPLRGKARRGLVQSVLEILF